MTLTFFYYFKQFEEKPKIFLLTLVDRNSFFVPNSSTDPLSSLVFLERQRWGREEEGNPHPVGVLESTHSNTFNGPKQTVLAEGKWALERQWREKWGPRVVPPGGSCTSLWTWAVCVPCELGTLLHLPAHFPSSMMSITWPAQRLHERTGETRRHTVSICGRSDF